MDEVLAWLAQAKEKVAEVFGDEDRLVLLGEQEVAARSSAIELARNLSAARGKAGKRFGTAVTSELQALAMPDSVLAVKVETAAQIEDFGTWGADEIEFLLQPHSGTGPLPIGKGASGGELSRVMLAIEVVLAGVDPVPTFVFDEVDAGIGGRAAVEVGRRLARLARTAQVIVVTHLPQVAAFADQLAKSPTSLPQMLVALDASLAKPRQIVIAGPRDAAATRALLRETHARFIPNKLVLLADGGAGQQWLGERLEFVKTVGPINGQPAAFVCENFVCQLPVSDVVKLRELLAK